MPLEANSPEFHRLATGWLDGVATATEAEKFWAAVKDNPACARAFADLCRFELLLENTSKEISSEAVVIVSAGQGSARLQKRKVLMHSMKAAALLVAAGVLVKFLWPVDSASPEVTINQPAVAKTPSKPPAKIMSDRLYVTPTPTAGMVVAGASTKSLQQHLDEFFLTSVSLEKLTLRDAIHQLEAQLRLLNVANAADLARLQVRFPANAAGREVTFHSGAISFLKAVRAVAALANCEVEANETGIALNSRIEHERELMQTRAVNNMLAANSVGLHSDRNELLEDARSLGMVANDDKSLSGTAAQFEALEQMANSRLQISQMPVLGLMAYLRPSHPNDSSRVLSPTEMNLQASRGDALAEIKVKPTSSINANTSPTGPDVLLSVVPAGDGVQLTLEPNQFKIANGGNQQPHLPIDVVVPRGGGASVPVQLAFNSRTKTGETPAQVTVADPIIIGGFTSLATAATGQVLRLDASNFTLSQAALNVEFKIPDPP